MATIQAYFRANKERYLEFLVNLAKVASISSSSAHANYVGVCADMIEDQMKKIGLNNVEQIRIKGALPYVYGELIRDPKLPTALLYSHFDVQPVGEEGLWKSPPFSPVRRGGRLYGRGTSDDKAGIVAHLAAIDSCLKTEGILPLNIKCIFEGEEEIGSENLDKLLAKYAKKLQADYIVIADTENFADGVPGITTQLRGLISMDVELRALKQPLHSGQFGGPVPDPVMALAKLLEKLTDDKGRIAIPGIYADVKKLSEPERRLLKKLPFDEKHFRAQAQMLPATRLAGEPGYTVYEQIWHRPAISINAIQASARDKVSNIIVDSAWAHFGIRIVPNMSEKKTSEQIVKFLQKNAPKDMELKVTPGHSVSWWSADTTAPALMAAKRALKKGFGNDAIQMGCGGSIGFVEPFSKALGGAPAILLGIEDPECNAHSYNESLQIANWEKTVESMMHLYQELAIIK